ncbi:MAG: hypothetical protein KAS66_00025 [Candidatus Omnitrophica bacterium]|nr:hypothetical protein [Candidatus Omnitrophota bacterium]
MIKNIDRKIGYWIIIAIPIMAFLVGFVVFNRIELLCPVPVILAVYLYYSMHRCHECRKVVFSWARRCEKCEDMTKYHKTNNIVYSS